MVHHNIDPKYDLRSILEALLDELSRGSPPLLDRQTVEYIIDQGKPNQTGQLVITHSIRATHSSIEGSFNKLLYSSSLSFSPFSSCCIAWSTSLVAFNDRSTNSGLEAGEF
jgi:hypothetical protein